MEKYFLFLKKPFSFHGRFNKIQYLKIFFFTVIISFISIGGVILLFDEGGVYQKPYYLISAEKKMYVAEDKFSDQFNRNAFYPEEFRKNQVLERDLEKAETTFYRELKDFHDNIYFYKILFIIILNTPLALLLIASGTKRSHDIGDSGILQIALPVYIWILLFKNSEQADNIHGAYIFSDIKISDNKNNIETMISDICPHCKNPNTNRSTTCEWCGNQIA